MRYYNLPLVPVHIAEMLISCKRYF